LDLLVESGGVDGEAVASGSRDGSEEGSGDGEETRSTE
jgi:hypothetical protein